MLKKKRDINVISVKDSSGIEDGHRAFLENSKDFSGDPTWEKALKMFRTPSYYQQNKAKNLKKLGKFE
jgi:hypothetical protein